MKTEDPNEVLANLLLAAKDDLALRAQVLSLIRTPTAQRESLINTAIHEMRLRGEPASACAAFSMLATDSGAKAALQVLG